MDKTYGLKTMVRGAYDLQKLRIQMGNRIIGNFKVKIGQEPGKTESTLNAEEKKILESMRESYKTICHGLKNLPPKHRFKADGVIDTYTEFCLMDEYIELERAEHRAFRKLKSELSDHPIWSVFLEDVRGVGPAMAGVIISEIDITKAEYPSSLWKYAGLDVASDGNGRSRKKEHLVDAEYITADGEVKTRKSITFNPFLKTKLVGVLGASFLRAGKDNTYAKAYYEYKNRIENHPAHVEKSKGHRHNMATRYMVKRFLVDLYKEWRKLEGLPVSPEYSEAKLGKVHRVA